MFNDQTYFDQAVIDDVRRIVDGILTVNSGIPLPDCDLIHDFDEAYYFAFENVIPPSGKTWEIFPNFLHDMKTDALSFYYETVPEPTSQQRRVKRQTDFALVGVLETKLKDTPFNTAAEQICADIEIMLYYKSLKPEKDVFGKKICQIYAAGGWPCGWNGKYPKGKPIVFWPFKDAPKIEA
jgi:hypothetical protein